MDTSRTLLDVGLPARRSAGDGGARGGGRMGGRTGGRPGWRHDGIRVFDERAQRRGELVLDRYRLLERLGAGGFGTVWRARDEQLGRDVALKRIGLPSPEDRERAVREARATARLSHPAIVALYEACADEDSFYLISELVDGCTLADLIARDELDDEEIARIGVALLDALRHAHARGVVHRDVKPQNVLVPDRGGEQRAGSGGSPAPAKLADFGGALLTGGEAITRTGDVFGTLAYMAPEQSHGREVGPAADLYSLALVLYEAFSGVNPVRGRTPAATAKRIGGPIERLQRHRRDLPRELTRALDAALDRDPRRRGTPADLQEALAVLASVAEPRRRFGRSRLIAPAPVPGFAPAVPFAQAAERDREYDIPRPLVGVPRRPGQAERGRASAQPAHDPAADEIPELGRPRFAAPRIVWLGLLLALAVWQAAAGRAGVSLLLLAGGAPLFALPRRSGPGWLAAALAPALGVAGLAGAFPALAGQRSSWRSRAALAALGFWWLALAEPLLARRLWLGPPPGAPPRAAWEASLGSAATHVVGAVLTPSLALGALAWALAATVLPWAVRGRSAALDVLAALAWTLALLAAVPLLERGLLAHPGGQRPYGIVLGAVLGCALAICARALRGPVRRTRAVE